MQSVTCGVGQDQRETILSYQHDRRRSHLAGNKVTGAELRKLDEDYPNLIVDVSYY